MTDPCQQRHLHATTLTPAMKLRGLHLQRCACGLQYAAKPNTKEN